MSMLDSIIAQSRRRFDADASAYIAAVEAADAQALEDAVRIAYNTFIVGIKSDAGVAALASHPIKAACILAGARTLSGALVPLVGTAPTNNNFVSGDYNRETGLIGNGSTKYLNTNRLDSADGQDNHHLSFYVTTAASSGYYGAGNALLAGIRGMLPSGANLRQWSKGTQNDLAGQSGATGFIGVSRSASGSFTARASSTDTSVSNSTTGNVTQNIYIFCRNGTSNTPAAFGNGRIAFYSVGSNLNLALLDARLATLMSALAAAIP